MTPVLSYMTFQSHKAPFYTSTIYLNSCLLAQYLILIFDVNSKVQGMVKEKTHSNLLSLGETQLTFK